MLQTYKHVCVGVRLCMHNKYSELYEYREAVLFILVVHIGGGKAYERETLDNIPYFLYAVTLEYDNVRTLISCRFQISTDFAEMLCYSLCLWFYGYIRNCRELQ